MKEEWWNEEMVDVRPKGEWICVRWMQYKCSECGYDDIGTATNYCPNCGARMEVNDAEVHGNDA